MSRLILLALLATPLFAQDSLLQAIDAQNKRVIAALTAGDARAYADLFAEDGFVMSPGAAVIHGRENIYSSRRSVLEKVKVLSARLATISLEQKGEIAWEIGSFWYELQGEMNEKRTVSGKYLVIWEQQADGSWQIKGDVGLPDP